MPLVSVHNQSHGSLSHSGSSLRLIGCSPIPFLPQNPLIRPVVSQHPTPSRHCLWLCLSKSLQNPSLPGCLCSSFLPGVSASLLALAHSQRFVSVLLPTLHMSFAGEACFSQQPSFGDKGLLPNALSHSSS